MAHLAAAARAGAKSGGAKRRGSTYGGADHSGWNGDDRDADAQKARARELLSAEEKERKARKLTAVGHSREAEEEVDMASINRLETLKIQSSRWKTIGKHRAEIALMATLQTDTPPEPTDIAKDMAKKWQALAKASNRRPSLKPAPIDEQSMLVTRMMRDIEETAPLSVADAHEEALTSDRLVDKPKSDKEVIGHTARGLDRYRLPRRSVSGHQTSVFMIHPEHPQKVKFDMLVGALIVFSVLAVPFRLGFRVEDSSSLILMDIIIDSIFGVDIIATFRTAYFDDDLVRRPHRERATSSIPSHPRSCYWNT